MKNFLVVTFLLASSICLGQTFEEDTLFMSPSLTAQGANMDADTDTDIVYVDDQGDVIIAEKTGVGSYTHHNVDSGHHLISSLRLADIDNDLDNDIIIGSYLDSITILENLGGFTFNRTAYYIGNYVCDVEVAHFNGDNLIDIVATARQDDAVFVLENSASGFIPHQVSTSYLASKVDTADFNGDGDIDILVAGIHGSSGAGQIEWLENNGNFTFTSHTISSVGNYDIFAANLDGDGDIDVVSANTFNGEISYWLNNGSNSFTKTVIHQLTCCALSIWAEDMNNDGIVDILSGDEESAGLLLHTNDGSLNFTMTTIASEYNSYEFEVLDEDNDGDMDIITASYPDVNGGTGVSLFRNSILTPDIDPPVPSVATLSNITSECPVTPTVPTAQDSEVGAINGVSDVLFPITDSGTTTITWTYDDGNGNVATQTQDVVINPIDITTVTNLIIDDQFMISANATGYSYQWIENCGNSNDVIVGEVMEDFIATGNGIYAVIIDNGICTDTSDCVVIDEVGLGENDLAAELIVYPNPTLGNISVDLGAVYSNVSIQVYNAIGKVLVDDFYESTKEFDLIIEGESGVYILEINVDEDRTARMNIIKK